MVGGLRAAAVSVLGPERAPPHPNRAFGALSSVLNTHLVVSPTSRNLLISLPVPFSPALYIPRAHTSRLLLDPLCLVMSASSKPAPLFPSTVSNTPLLPSHRLRPSTPWLSAGHDVWNFLAYIQDLGALESIQYSKGACKQELMTNPHTPSEC